MDANSNISTIQVADRFRRILKLKLDHAVKQSLVDEINAYVQSVYDQQPKSFFVRHFLPEPLKLDLTNLDQKEEMLKTLKSFWVKDKSKKVEAKKLSAAFNECDFSKGVAAELILSKFNRVLNPLSTELMQVLGPVIRQLVQQIKTVDQVLQASMADLENNLTAVDIEMEICREAIKGWVDKSPITLRYLNENFPGVDVSSIDEGELPEDLSCLETKIIDPELLSKLDEAAGALIESSTIQQALRKAINLHAQLKQKAVLLAFIRKFNELHDIPLAPNFKQQVAKLVEYQKKLAR